jgi:hypothetical protein
MKGQKIILVILLTITFTNGYSQFRDSLNANPNPFNLETTILAGFAKQDTVSLGLYNMFGQCIKKFMSDSIVSPGYHSIGFKGDLLPDGNYILILRLRANKSLNKRIVKSTNLTGINNRDFLPQNLTLRPNPTSGLLEIPFKGMKNIVITNLIGDQYPTLKTELENISLNYLEHGVYIVRVFSEDNVLLAVERIFKIE